MSGHECGLDSLADINFSILSGDCQVPSPDSIGSYGQSPPHQMFGSPAGQFECKLEPAACQALDDLYLNHPAPSPSAYLAITSPLPPPSSLLVKQEQGSSPAFTDRLDDQEQLYLEQRPSPAFIDRLNDQEQLYLEQRPSPAFTDRLNDQEQLYLEQRPSPAFTDRLNDQEQLYLEQRPSPAFTDRLNDQEQLYLEQRPSPAFTDRLNDQEQLYLEQQLSPFSDAGYGSHTGSPPHLSSEDGVASLQTAPLHPPGPPLSGGQDHQVLRQCLRDTSLQRRLNVQPFNLGLLYPQPSQSSAAGCSSGSWMMEQLGTVFDLALEEVRQDKMNVCRSLGISPDPTLWSVDQVRTWLSFTCQQFSLTPVQTDCLNLDGPALCSLTEEEFKLCLPQQSADVLYAQLLVWLSSYQQPCSLQAVRAAVKADMPGGAAAVNRDEEVTESDDEDDEVKPLSSRSGSHIHLWQFLKELLTNPQLYGASIRWIEQSKGIFKIEDSLRVAKLWGKRKNRPAMNYDKLSRSIRQYYKKGIMKKTERSQRLVYQFCHPYAL